MITVKSQVTFNWSKAGVLTGSYFADGWTKRRATGSGYCKASTITAYWLNDVLGAELNAAVADFKLGCVDDTERGLVDFYGVNKYGDMWAFAKAVGIESHRKAVEALGYQLESLYSDAHGTVGYMLLKEGA